MSTQVHESPRESVAGSEVQVLLQGRCAVVSLHRPERLNALTRRMETELRSVMGRLDADPQVRAIVLTGSGRAFCAGMDMDELGTLAADDIQQRFATEPFDMNASGDVQGRYNYFPSLRKPVIAAINGAAAGLGLIFALYSDLRFASTRAVFSTAFSRRGLIAEHGSAWILPRVVGLSKAADLLFSARRVDAQEALQIGLVDRVWEPEALLSEAVTYAAMLTDEVSPRSLAVMKRQLWEAQSTTLGAAVIGANREMVASIRSPHFREGVDHFVQKRAPKFPDTLDLHG